MITMSAKIYILNACEEHIVLNLWCRVLAMSLTDENNGIMLTILLEENSYKYVPSVLHSANLKF